MATGSTNIIIKPFDVNDLDDIGRRWKSWQMYLLDYFKLKKIVDDAERLINLRVLGGLDLAEHIRETMPDETSYEKVVTDLTKEFTPLKTLSSSVAQYRRLYQYEGESFDKFAARMKTEAIKCDFPRDSTDISQQLYTGSNSAEFKRSYLSEQYKTGVRPTREETIKLGQLAEVLQQEMRTGQVDRNSRINQLAADADVEAELRAEIAALRAAQRHQEEQQDNGVEAELRAEIAALRATSRPDWATQRQEQPPSKPTSTTKFSKSTGSST